MQSQNMPNRRISSLKRLLSADYRPASIAAEKMKKKEDALTIELERTDDILKYLGEHKHPQQFLCGFSMETEHMLENSRKKLEKKHLDMIVANNLKQAGAGFGTDTNVVTRLHAGRNCTRTDVQRRGCSRNCQPNFKKSQLAANLFLRAAYTHTIHFLLLKRLKKC